MDASGPIEVHDPNGAQAIVEAASRPGVGRDGQVALWLEDGRRVVVPGNALEPQEDGTYYLPIKLEDLREEAAGMTGTDAGAETLTVPVVEEQINVYKRAVEQRVRVSKTTHEREQVIDEPLLQEDVEVERVPVGRQVDGPVPVRYEGDTMIVPVLEEILVVEKRLMLREELRITRRQTEVREVRRETVRAEEVTVERVPADQAAQSEGDERPSGAA